MDNINTLSWHERIKFTRISLNLSQSEAAALLEVSERTYRDWEAGKHFPSYPAQRALRRHFDITAQDLGLLPLG